jgi:hypothetical protein
VVSAAEPHDGILGILDRHSNYQTGTVISHTNFIVNHVHTRARSNCDGHTSLCFGKPEMETIYTNISHAKFIY